MISRKRVVFRILVIGCSKDKSFRVGGRQRSLKSSGCMEFVRLPGIPSGLYINVDN